jgi:hypothetical protein
MVQCIVSFVITVSQKDFCKTWKIEKFYLLTKDKKPGWLEASNWILSKVHFELFRKSLYVITDNVIVR